MGKREVRQGLQVTISEDAGTRKSATVIRFILGYPGLQNILRIKKALSPTCQTRQWSDHKGDVSPKMQQAGREQAASYHLLPLKDIASSST